jgi:hypothetical protein
MTSISLETPKYATFILGDGMPYQDSKILVLRSPTKMTDIVIKVSYKGGKKLERFSIMAVYLDGNGDFYRVNYSNLYYVGGEQHMATLETKYDGFICTHLKFTYDTQIGETEEFLITVDKFDDDKEKNLFALRHDSQLPDYKDEI